MPKDNVTPLKFGSVTLDSVKKSLDAWRSTKKPRMKKYRRLCGSKLLVCLKGTQKQNYALYWA